MRANTARCVECVIVFRSYKTLQDEYTLGSSLCRKRSTVHANTSKQISLSLDSTLSLRMQVALILTPLAHVLSLSPHALYPRAATRHTLKKRAAIPGTLCTHTSKLFTHKKKNKPAVHSQTNSYVCAAIRRLLVRLRRLASRRHEEIGLRLVGLCLTGLGVPRLGVHPLRVPRLRKRRARLRVPRRLEARWGRALGRYSRTLRLEDARTI